MRKRPPRLAQRLFTWYCRNELHESILGDLEEQYFQNLQQYGAQRANRIYWAGVLSFINRFTLKTERSSNHNYTSGMFKNNFLSSWRFLLRNKGFTFINIFGLTIGLCSFLLIYLYTNHALSFDEFHQNKELVHRVNFSYQDNAGNVTKLVNSPPALASGILGKYPELDKISKMRYAMNCLFSKGDIQFYEDHGYFADSLFLEVLPFEMTYGNPETALDQPNSIVISESLALKYFDTPNPVGSTLLLNNATQLQVTGVLKDVPTNSHLDFNYLISFSTYVVPEGYASDLTSWSWLGFLTYVSLKPQADASAFEAKLIAHFKSLNPDNPNPMLPSLQPLHEVYLHSQGMADDLASHLRSGNPFMIRALLTVSLLILIVATFNFTNLTQALSINRNKPVGIRKVLGASKASLLSQLLTESMLLATVCLLLAAGLGVLTFPALSSYLGWGLDLQLTTVWKPLLLLALISIFVGLLSGLYPALRLIRSDLTKALKGTLHVRSKGPFQWKHLLLMLQFSISVGLIATTIVMTRQISYLQTQETGYSSENVVLIKLLPEQMTRYYDRFKEEMTQHAAVMNLSRSERVVGDPWPWSIIQRADQGPEASRRVFFNLADYDYFETMDISVLQGRAFSKDFTNDPTRAIVINQQAAEYLGLDDPIGKQVHFFEQDGPRTIVGMVEDFNYASLHQEIGPAVVILPFIDLEYLYVRFDQGDLFEHISLLEDTWASVTQDAPLEWRFLDDNLAQLYQSEEQLTHTIQVFSVLAIVLASLGLFGIVTFMINNRIKEIGVRKVLGASVKVLYILFIKRYLYQVTIAMLFVVPVIHYLLNGWLQDFAYHIDISWVVYPISASALLLIILLTVSFQIIKAAKENPTKLLRTE